MNKNYDFHFEENVLFLIFNDSIKDTTINDAVEEINNTFPNKQINIVAYKNILGYWSAINWKNNDPIYCGTRSIKDTRETIKKYLENEIKNSSN